MCDARHFSQCVVPENIDTSPTEGPFKISGRTDPAKKKIVRQVFLQSVGICERVTYPVKNGI